MPLKKNITTKTSRPKQRELPKDKLKRDISKTLETGKINQTTWRVFSAYRRQLYLELVETHNFITREINTQWKPISIPKLTEKMRVEEIRLELVLEQQKRQLEYLKTQLKNAKLRSNEKAYEKYGDSYEDYESNPEYIQKQIEEFRKSIASSKIGLKEFQIFRNKVIEKSRGGQYPAGSLIGEIEEWTIKRSQKLYSLAQKSTNPRERRVLEAQANQEFFENRSFITEFAKKEQSFPELAIDKILIKDLKRRILQVEEGIKEGKKNGKLNSRLKSVLTSSGIKQLSEAEVFRIVERKPLPLKYEFTEEQFRKMVENGVVSQVLNSTTKKYKDILTQKSEYTSEDLRQTLLLSLWITARKYSLQQLPMLASRVCKNTALSLVTKYIRRSKKAPLRFFSKPNDSRLLATQKPGMIDSKSFSPEALLQKKEEFFPSIVNIENKLQNLVSSKKISDLESKFYFYSMFPELVPNSIRDRLIKLFEKQKINLFEDKEARLKLFRRIDRLLKRQ